MSLSLIAHIQGEMQSKILVVEWFDQGNGVILSGLIVQCYWRPRAALATARIIRDAGGRKAVPLSFFLPFPSVWLQHSWGR